MPRSFLSLSGLLLTAVALSVSGCKPEPKVTSYAVPAANPQAGRAVSEQTPAQVQTPPQATTAAASAAAPMPATASMKAEAASFEAPKWAQLPAGWSVGPENAMRKATWVVTGPDGTKAEIAVTVFPGNVGGLTANVNRWRGQLGLPAASPDEIAAAAKPAKVGDIASQRFLMVSADGKKALDAVMTPHGGATWFFKMSGDAAAVAAHGDALSDFLAASRLP